MRSRRFWPLLRWRQAVVGTKDERILELCLTVEGLPRDAVPPAYAGDVRRWRKLPRMTRSRFVRSFLWRSKVLGVGR